MKLFLKSFFLVFCLLGPDLWASADTVLQEEITSEFEGDVLDQNHLFIVREAFLEETFKKLRLKDITSQMKKEDQD